MSQPGTAGIRTYHCLCNTHVLTTTHDLSLLPRRASPSLDKAYILPCPPQPTVRSADDAKDYTQLTSSIRSGKAFIIQGSDGLEKRFPMMCQRCGLVVGFWLDRSQFKGGESDQESQATTQQGKHEDVVYILPGAVVTTADMKAGHMPEAELGLGAS